MAYVVGRRDIVPGSIVNANIADGTITLAKLDAGIGTPLGPDAISADATGRAYMEDGLFDAATIDAKVDDKAILPKHIGLAQGSVVIGDAGAGGVALDVKTAGGVLVGNGTTATVVDIHTAGMALVGNGTTAVATAIAGGAITDAGAWYTVDTLQGVADAVSSALGGTSQAVRNYTQNKIVADNDTFYSAIDKLDTSWYNLSQLGAGNGITKIALTSGKVPYGVANVAAETTPGALPVVDGSTWFTTDTFQGVADGLVAAIGGTSQGVRAYTKNTVLADDESLYASLEKLDTYLWGLLQVSTGANKVGLTNGKTLVGSGSVATETDPGALAITDGGNWLTVDTIQGGVDGLIAAIGGTSQGVRAYTKDEAVTDNQSLVASIDALDTRFWDLKQVTTGVSKIGLTTGKVMVGTANVGAEADPGALAILDTAAPADYFTSDTIQGAADELKAAIGGTSSGVRNYSSNLSVADNDDITVALGKLDKTAGLVADSVAWAVLAAADCAGGNTESAFTLKLYRMDGTTALAFAKEVMVKGNGASATLGAATKGTIVDGGAGAVDGWAITTDANGEFACTITNAADETLYIYSAEPPYCTTPALALLSCKSLGDSVTWAA